ncbi:MAG: hypothetical protein RL033_6408 [Pseudomonadota bacterium]
MRVWLFNLDAERELASSGPYQTPLRLSSLFQPWTDQAARSLLDPEDLRLEQWSPGLPTATPPLGACWSPTPSALLRLTKAGLPLPPSPAVEVLRRVCHRQFYLSLGGGAPGACFITDSERLEEVLAARASAPWLFKRPFGFAGRGQRRMGATLSADDRRWLADGLRLGGLLAEPWLELECELSVHGFVAPDGSLRLGRLCKQRTDAWRAWLSTDPLASDELKEADRRALFDSAERVAESLLEAGYFGPFGIDAYTWRDATGKTLLNPLGELNARYTMGYGVGMAAR